MKDNGNYGLSKNAVKIFEDLYSFQEESIKETFSRVAGEFCVNKEDFELAFGLLANGYWRPNTPTWLNAGTNHKVFSACYVSGLKDSMDSIYGVANIARRIFQHGAGIGIPIGNLRESDAWIFENNTDMLPRGKSSGPITFMKLYDAVGETTKSGGRVRRAAILCSLPVWHPDIFNFIKCKEEDGRLSNMNISVSITDKFIEALENNIPFDLVTPYNGEKVAEVDPQELWDTISTMAWKTADPGVFFIDTVNKFNPLSSKILIETSNPCGEQFLIPNNCCNLSAINVHKFVGNNEYDWDGLYKCAFDIMGLMDNVIDTMDYPDDQFKYNSINYRPVGVGIMGLADALFDLELRYDGSEGRKFAGKVMRTITTACIHKSALMAEDKGTFYNYDIHREKMEEIIETHIGLNESDEISKVMDLVRQNGVRNIQFTTCMPTGTTALSCDASYGMEPSFGLVFQKNLISGEKMMVANKIFENKYKNEDWFNDTLIERIFKNGGSLKGVRGIPKDVREVFVTAHDIKSRDRIDMQSEIQMFTSNAISSTINLPKETTKEEISDIFLYAYKKGLKGVTIYRDGSKYNQPVTFAPVEENKEYTRPNVMDSKTYTVATGNGKMYVTISEHKGKPLELFVNIGKSGQILNTLTEALGRATSIALQRGVPVEEIIKTLININSDKIAWHKFEETDKRPVQILSIPDGIAKLLSKYYSGITYEGELSGELCEKCGNSMTAVEGCFSCSACGHSRCS